MRAVRKITSAISAIIKPQNRIVLEKIAVTISLFFAIPNAVKPVINSPAHIHA